LRNAARNKYNVTKAFADGLLYRKRKGVAQRVLKNSSKEHWQNYCTSLNNRTKLGFVWKMSKKMSGVKSSFKISKLKHENTIAESNEDKANLLADTFAQASSNQNYSPTFQQHKTEFEINNVVEFTDSSNKSEQNTALNYDFSLQELKSAIKQSKKSTQPGADTITYEMLKELPSQCLSVLLKLYNNVWQSGTLPKDWKHALVIPLHKPDKDLSSPSSYRPIILTSCICKIMERVVTNRMTWYLEVNNLLNNAQTGFRKRRSTIDQIIKLQDTIHKYNNNKGFTVGIFLDFEKAYDMVWKAGLMTKVKALGINGRMFAFINDFMNARSIQVIVGGAESTSRNLDNGTPQGSILSPLLFVIMINDISVSKPDVNLSLYADDSATYKGGTNLNFIVKQLQICLNDIYEWCEKWGVKISVTKSCVVVFTNKRKFQMEKPLNINGINLKVESKVKFLGMIFDQKLNWNKHVKFIEKKCKSRLNLMTSLTGTGWGSNKSSLLSIYRALIRSLLDYGAVALDSAPPSTKARLDTIQTKALKIACGAMRGTALSALQNECGEMPLGLRRRNQQLQ
jgi:hypothetical protein